LCSSPATADMTMWHSLAVDGADLVDAVEDAINKSDDDRLEALLCGAVKTLRASRSKPDSALFLALMCLAKNRPTLFHSDVVTEVLHSLVNRALEAVQASNVLIF